MIVIKLNINGREERLDVPGDTPLLYVLRNDLGLNGPKFGCGLAQCGACMVLVDGRPMQSCAMPASAAEGREVTTLEGLGGRENPHPLQLAFIEEQAMQCGYCASGMIVSGAALLKANPDPSEAEIRGALKNNLCRCGTHNRILKAVRRAAGNGGGQAS